MYGFKYKYGSTFSKIRKSCKKKSHNCGDKMQKYYSSHNPFNGHTASS